MCTWQCIPFISKDEEKKKGDSDDEIVPGRESDLKLTDVPEDMREAVQGSSSGDCTAKMKRNAAALSSDSVSPWCFCICARQPKLKAHPQWEVRQCHSFRCGKSCQPGIDGNTLAGFAWLRCQTRPPKDGALRQRSCRMHAVGIMEPVTWTTCDLMVFANVRSLSWS